MSVYIYLLGGNIQLSALAFVCKPNKEKVIESYVYVNFSGGWYQAEIDNAENVMPCTGYVIMYA